MGVPLAGRTSGGRSRVKCLVPGRGARRDMVIDEVSAAIPRDAVARNGRTVRPGRFLAGSAPVNCSAFTIASTKVLFSAGCLVLDTCRDIFLKVQSVPSVHKVLQVHDI